MREAIGKVMLSLTYLLIISSLYEPPLKRLLLNIQEKYESKTLVYNLLNLHYLAVTI